MKTELSTIIMDGMDVVECIRREVLNKNTVKRPLEDITQIEWQNTVELYIFGDDTARLADGGLEAGCYLDSDVAEKVIVLGANNERITKIINRCGGRLRTLDLRFLDMEILELPIRFDNLERLRLSPMERLSEVKGLKSLRNLIALDLSFTDMGTGFDVTQMPKLRRLELAGNTKLKRINGVSQLMELEELELSGTNIGAELDLTPFEKLKRVRLVDTSALERVFGFGSSPELEYLDLSCSGIKRIPDDIRSLQKLVHLDLSNLSLDDIPDWLTELNLDFTYCDDGINLRNTVVPGADMKLFTEQVDDQSFADYQKRVRQWFEDRKNEVPKPLNEIKVVFLGDGEAGKSHTIARLMNDGGEPENYDGQVTPGVAIHDKMYDIEGQQVQVHFWDFGGQAILHSMHRMFLTNRTLYVILLNSRHESPNKQALYWLNNVKIVAPDAPILLVLNKIDQNPNAAVNEPVLRERYPSLREVVRLSSLEFTQEQFNAVFVQVMLRQIKQSGVIDTMFPSAWMRLRDKLKSLPDNYINDRTYFALCDSCGVDVKLRKPLLSWFADIGILFYRGSSPRLADYIVLKPNWILNAISMLLFNQIGRHNDGMLYHIDIYRILLKDGGIHEQIYCEHPEIIYTHSDVEYILNILREFQVSFSLDSEREFFPMYCSLNASLSVKEYQTDESVLEFVMEFDYLPISVLHQLIVARHQELDLQNVWRTGARFVQADTGLSAVVVIEGTFLHFYIQHTNPMHRPNTYLTMLKGNVSRIWQEMGLKAPRSRLVYKIRGNRTWFDYERLLKLQERGRKEEYCEELDEDFKIDDILNQAAPAGLADEKILIEDIVRSCQQLQANKMYIASSEDDRNTYVRDYLRTRGYIVHDQSAVGLSANGKLSGEIDLDIRYTDTRPWTICEALRVQGKSKDHWNAHLTKLLQNYNPNGLPFLVLLTYTEVSKERFLPIMHSYEEHIRCYEPRPFVNLRNSYQKVDVLTESAYIKVSKCRYRSGEYTPTVYHIFVRMGE